MREITFFFPLTDNGGASLAWLIAQLETSLLTAFGGYTKQTGIAGAWRDETTGAVYRDDSNAYTIAADWAPGREKTLDRLIAHYGRRAGQLCIFKRGADSVVEFVQCAAPYQAQAKGAA